MKKIHVKNLVLLYKQQILKEIKDIDNQDFYRELFKFLVNNKANFTVGKKGVDFNIGLLELGVCYKIQDIALKYINYALDLW